MKQYSFPKDKIKVLLLEGIHPSAIKIFEDNGYSTIEALPGALDDEALIAKLDDVYMLGIRSRTQLTETILRHPNAKKLITVGCFCIGTNQVNLDVAQQQGIVVFNAPFSNTRSVAELVIAECVFLMRHVSEKNMLAHQGGWLKSASHANEVRGKTLGIVGYGHIGTQVSVLAEGLGMRVIYFDIEKKLSIGNAQCVGSLKELCQASDIVTLHVPDTPFTRNMMNATSLAWMKPGSYLINCARGQVVDIPALTASLQSKHLLGVALDVFPFEPASEKEKFECPLQGFGNAILTPHIGGSTEEAQENIGIEVAEKMVLYSDNGSTNTAQNFVEVTLPPNQDKRRILHIHNNVPGTLEKINHVFSKHAFNISAQHLQTNSQIGYVIIDLDNRDIGPEILQELRDIPNTIRVRMLY